MSTNYYVKTAYTVKKVCDCGFEHEVNEILHVGKSCYGWKFALHIIPEKNINELSDWIKILKEGYIYDEYDNPITFHEFLDIINSPSSVSANENVSQDSNSILDVDGKWYNKTSRISSCGVYTLEEGDFC